MRALVLVFFVIITCGCTAKEESKLMTPDTTSPTVVSTFPADGDSNVNLLSEISCTFSENMDCMSFDSTSFYLVWGLTRVPAHISCNGKTVTLSPETAFAHDRIYQTYVSFLVSDLAGNRMDSSYSWSFNTTDGPSVISTYPLDGDTGVNLFDTIMVIFADDMDCSTIDLSTITFSDGVTGSIECFGDTVLFIPDSVLSRDHAYTAAILRNVTDTAGNVMKNDYIWSFTTTGGPYVLETDPDNGAWHVSPASSISVTFSDDMDTLTITTETFYLDGAVSGAITYDDRTATFWPDDTLMLFQIYTATIKDDITDINGNPLESDYSWSFEVRRTIMPLAIGNWWIYYIERWDTLGHLLDDYYDTTIIIDDTIIGDELWYLDNDGNLYINRTDGLWIKGVSDQYYMQAKYPAEIGESYVLGPNYVTHGHGLFRVTSTSSSVTVDAGVFTCFEYTSEPPHWEYFYYCMDYALDVGLVKFNSFQWWYFYYPMGEYALVRQHRLVDYHIQ